MTTNINDMIQSLADAKIAMELVPVLERDNKTLTESLDICHEKGLKADDRIAELQAQLEKANRQLTLMEADLKDARFCHAETSNRLQTLQSLVGGALSASAPTPTAEPEARSEPEVSPKPIPEPIPTASAPSEPSHIHGGSETRLWVDPFEPFRANVIDDLDPSTVRWAPDPVHSSNPWLPSRD